MYRYSFIDDCDGIDEKSPRRTCVDDVAAQHQMLHVAGGISTPWLPVSPRFWQMSKKPSIFSLTGQ
jgi:hypothetical protein